MLKDFKVDTRTQFYDAENKRIQRGDWYPTHYLYVMGNDGRQWLIVGPEEQVTIAGKHFRLHAVSCHISGIDRFDKPQVGRKIHKIFG